MLCHCRYLMFISVDCLCYANVCVCTQSLSASFVEQRCHHHPMVVPIVLCDVIDVQLGCLPTELIGRVHKQYVVLFLISGFDNL